MGAAPAKSPASNALHAVLVDERHTESCSAGARLASRGTPVHATADGDITQIWQRQIAPAWRRKPVTVAGLTERPALFCLEQFAWAFGLRVVFHTEHIVHPGGLTEHWLLRGAPAADLSARDLRLAGASWPTRIAAAITAHREQAARVRFGPSGAALDPALPAGAQLLTAWIIAPA
jgi:hypothetical protein